MVLRYILCGECFSEMLEIMMKNVIIRVGLYTVYAIIFT